MTLRKSMPFWGARKSNVPSLPPSTTVFGSLPSGSNKWLGGVLSEEGNIYGIPCNSVSILKINPLTDSLTTFGSIAGSNKWHGGVRASTGIIYGIPFSAPSILRLNPHTDSFSFISGVSGSNKYIGGVLANNGMIYCIPFNATQIMKIDPFTDTYSFFGSFLGTAKWTGGFLAEDGNIYAIPATSTQFLKIDPSTDSASLVGPILSTADKFRGGNMYESSTAYIVSANYPNRTSFDAITENLNDFSPNVSGVNFYGSVLGPNNKIYSIPARTDKVLEFDTINETFVNIGESLTVLSGDNWVGGVLSDQGNIYGIPAAATQVLKISNIGNITPDMYTFPSLISDLSISIYNKYQNKY